jgi:uncharacterized protein with HEPN domain
LRRASLCTTCRSPRIASPGSARGNPQVAAAIPDHAKIIGFRNILIHGYATVDDRIVWGVIENHLAPLRNAVQGLTAAP